MPCSEEGATLKLLYRWWIHTRHTSLTGCGRGAWTPGAARPPPVVDKRGMHPPRAAVRTSLSATMASTTSALNGGCAAGFLGWLAFLALGAAGAGAGAAASAMLMLRAVVVDSDLGAEC